MTFVRSLFSVSSNWRRLSYSVACCGGVALIGWQISERGVVSAATLEKPFHWRSKPITDLRILTNDNSLCGQMERMCMDLQGSFCSELEKLDRDFQFVSDRWERADDGGGGISCVMTGGNVFERAGVNISVVKGTLGPAAVKQMNARPNKNLPLDVDLQFVAIGISSVIHPRNPHVPIFHFNFRYFEVEDGKGGTERWFGGGADLTPIYLDNDNIRHFHKTLKAACDQHDKSYYNRFKQWCDQYFYIQHRQEHRGVGGIFFDDLNTPSADKAFAFISSCAAAVQPSYIPIVKKNMYKKYGRAEREWQLLRRGRYVEFNLVYDRGTKFGLNTPNARIESILISLPPLASWVYCYDPELNYDQSVLMAVLRKPKEWV